MTNKVQRCSGSHLSEASCSPTHIQPVGRAAAVHMTHLADGLWDVCCVVDALGICTGVCVPFYIWTVGMGMSYGMVMDKCFCIHIRLPGWLIFKCLV